MINQLISSPDVKGLRKMPNISHKHGLI